VWGYQSHRLLAEAQCICGHVRARTHNRAQPEHLVTSGIQSYANRLDATAFRCPRIHVLNARTGRVIVVANIWKLLNDMLISLQRNTGHTNATVNALNILSAQSSSIKRQRDQQLMLAEIEALYRPYIFRRYQERDRKGEERFVVSPPVSMLRHLKVERSKRLYFRWQKRGQD
jgi:hypothetical protein